MYDLPNVMAKSMYNKFLAVFVIFGAGQIFVCLYGPNFGRVLRGEKRTKEEGNYKNTRSQGVKKQKYRHLKQVNESAADLNYQDFDPFTNDIRPTNISIATRTTSASSKKFDGTWKSSFVSESYHKHYNVNCSALVYGDRHAVAEANRMMGKVGQKSVLPFPSDEVVQNWTRDCEKFRAGRHYPEKPRSSEEANYPLAFIIVTHKDSVQVERLLRAIYQPQNVYCIHPDAKSPPAYQVAIRQLAACFDNVFISSKIEDVQYAGFTRLQADINCMSDLLQHPIKWKYAMNLCGQDFPLKTNFEMVKQLETYGDKNDINGILPPPYIRGRTRSHYTVNNGKLIATPKQKGPPPHNLTIYFGNAYYAATRTFVNYVVNNRVSIDLLEWSNDTYSPDEHFWVTLNRDPRVPGGYPNASWDANVRFMKWGDIRKYPPCQGKYVRALCVFGVGYLKFLVQMPHLFANKFHYSFDPVILQCIEELLDFRAAYPETIANFVPNFPRTDLVWMSTNNDNSKNMTSKL